MIYNKENRFTFSRPFNILMATIVITLLMTLLDWEQHLAMLKYAKPILASLTALYIIIGFFAGAILVIIISIIIPFINTRLFSLIKRFYFSYFISKLLLLSLFVIVIGELFFIFSGIPSTQKIILPQKTLAKKKYNIVLITIDTLRRGNLGCYGYKRDTTPFIDSLARNGIIFENCISQSPWTLPSHASLFTSKYPSEHGADFSNKKVPMTEGFYQNRVVPLPAKEVTMAEILSKNAYLTAGFIGGDYLNSFFCLNQGFDFYNDNLPPYIKPFVEKLKFLDFFTNIGFIKKDKAIRIMNKVLIPLTNKFYRESFKLPENIYFPIGKRAEEINAAVFRWLDSYAEYNFFLFINYFDVHGPYDAPEPYKNYFVRPYSGKITGYSNPKHFQPADTQHLMDLYNGEIKYVDSQIARLFEKLELLGKKNNTIVIITSDHGESFGEHRFLGHGRTLYDELIRVPLIIWFPKMIKRPAIIIEPVELIDIMPTLFDILDIKIKRKISGESLLPLIENRRKTRLKDYTISQFFKNDYLKKWDYRYGISSTSLRKIDAKYIDNFSGNDEFYDILHDPEERINLIKKGKKKLIIFRNLLSSISLKRNVNVSEPKRLPDNRLKESLKALGYIR